jgi:hypothetical protein
MPLARRIRRPRTTDRSPDQQPLIAYPVKQPLQLQLEPSPANRIWMDRTKGGFANDRFAYRCLPLLIANQSGWVLLNDERFFAVWNGGAKPSDLKIVYQDGGAGPHAAISHFGDGILSFTIPFLFRTPPGFNLLVRGPANLPKDGASPLEGVVETDWTDATFSMSWKITRPAVPVIFGRAEPICMIVPQRRYELESFRPEVRALETDPAVQQGFDGFHEGRVAFQSKLQRADPEAVKQGWQRNYFAGVGAHDQHAPEHQTKLQLLPFSRVPSSEVLEPE